MAQFASFIAIPIQILIFLLAFPHIELGAPVIGVARAPMI